MDEKEILHRHLRSARDALFWKLDGLSEYDTRRPMTGTGTNLLGLVKHVAAVQAGYLGDCFGRPFPITLRFFGPSADPNDDMWAQPGETKADIVALWEASASHADATVEALDLDAEGQVPWWPADRNPVSLRLVIVHTTGDITRHAGQADIVREMIDGSVGLRRDNDNLPDVDAGWWADYVERLERTARQFDGAPPTTPP